MSEKPIVSIILPSIYPQLWMDTYSSLNIEKKVPFEIIAIGPVEPNFELPENFRYYKSSVKIPQCIEAGYRLAKGDYLLTISDDSAFKPNFLQKLYENINAVDMDRTFLVIQAARFWRGKIGSLYYKSRHKNIPKRERVLIGIYNCYKKDGIHAIGGIVKPCHTRAIRNARYSLRCNCCVCYDCECSCRTRSIE